MDVIGAWTQNRDGVLSAPALEFLERLERRFGPTRRKLLEAQTDRQLRIERRTAPYFYLPKMESHLEARLWNDVFVFAQTELGIPQGTIRRC